MKKSVIEKLLKKFVNHSIIDRQFLTNLIDLFEKDEFTFENKKIIPDQELVGRELYLIEECQRLIYFYLCNLAKKDENILIQLMIDTEYYYKFTARHLSLDEYDSKSTDYLTEAILTYDGEIPLERHVVKSIRKNAVNPKYRSTIEINREYIIQKKKEAEEKKKQEEAKLNNTNVGETQENIDVEFSKKEDIAAKINITSKEILPTIENTDSIEKVSSNETTTKDISVHSSLKKETKERTKTKTLEEKKKEKKFQKRKQKNFLEVLEEINDKILISESAPEKHKEELQIEEKKELTEELKITKKISKTSLVKKEEESKLEELNMSSFDPYKLSMERTRYCDGTAKTDELIKLFYKLNFTKIIDSSENSYYTMYLLLRFGFIRKSYYNLREISLITRLSQKIILEYEYYTVQLLKKMLNEQVNEYLSLAFKKETN